MSRGALRFTEEQYRAHAAKSDRFKVGTHTTTGVVRRADPAILPAVHTAGHSSPVTFNRPAADTPAAPPPASGGASKPWHVEWTDSDGSKWSAGSSLQIGAKSKYKNKPTNGYASIKESKRAFQLKLMQEAGQIRNLREQVSYLLIPKQEGERACSYVADFVYEEPPLNAALGSPRTVVEDCKGMKTDVYRLKRKLMLFVHQIRIRET